jgi:hypothetical protein
MWLQVENHYVPHAVNDDVFKKLPEEKVEKFKEENLGEKKIGCCFFLEQ